MTNIDSNDVRKIAKLVNTQRFDILSFSIYFMLRVDIDILFALEKDNISKRWAFINFAIFRTSLLSRLSTCWTSLHRG